MCFYRHCSCGSPCQTERYHCRPDDPLRWRYGDACYKFPVRYLFVAPERRNNTNDKGLEEWDLFGRCYEGQWLFRTFDRFFGHCLPGAGEAGYFSKRLGPYLDPGYVVPMEFKWVANSRRHPANGPRRERWCLYSDDRRFE